MDIFAIKFDIFSLLMQPNKKKRKEKKGRNNILSAAINFQLQDFHVENEIDFF